MVITGLKSLSLKVSKIKNPLKWKDKYNPVVERAILSTEDNIDTEKRIDTDLRTDITNRGSYFNRDGEETIIEEVCPKYLYQLRSLDRRDGKACFVCRGFSTKFYSKNSFLYSL